MEKPGKFAGGGSGNYLHFRTFLFHRQTSPPPPSHNQRARGSNVKDLVPKQIPYHYKAAENKQNAKLFA